MIEAKQKPYKETEGNFESNLDVLRLRLFQGKFVLRKQCQGDKILPKSTYVIFLIKISKTVDFIKHFTSCSDLKLVKVYKNV